MTNFKKGSVLYISVCLFVCLVGFLFGFLLPFVNFSFNTDVTGERLQMFTYARHLWPVSHPYSEKDHPFIMVITKDPWHSHLLRKRCLRVGNLQERCYCRVNLFTLLCFSSQHHLDATFAIQKSLLRDH